MTHPVRPWQAADPCTCAKPRSTPEFTPDQRATLARIEATPAAPESFDPIAALRRVEAVAVHYDRDGWSRGRNIAARIRAALSPSEPTPGAQA